MKVLVISHEYPPIGGGGGKVVQDLCTGLASSGIEIHVLTAMWNDLPEVEESKNLKIERLASNRSESFRASFKSMLSFVWKSTWRGLKLIRQWQPDLIHAHFAVPAGAAAFALSIMTGTPYILTAHGGDVPGGAPEKTGGWFRFILPLSRPIWKRASAIAAVSSQTRQLALAHYDAQIQVIPNGIDPQAYQPGEFSKTRLPAIIFIGRFSPEKNAQAVPKILALLPNQNWQCVMVGDGPDMGEVKQLISENNLAAHITLTGWVNPKDVQGLMAHSDILLMPSLRDAMPMAGLQALAMGQAIVASRIGSVPDLVRDGENGFLVEPGDLNGYADALNILINDAVLLEKCRVKSREMVNQFDMQHILLAYKTLYQQVLQQKEQ